MKKHILRVIAAMFAVIVALPVCSYAAEGDAAAEKDQVRLVEENGEIKVILSMPHSHGEGLNAVRMSFRVETNEDENVEFTFNNSDNAGDSVEKNRGYIHGSYYHKKKDLGGENGLLNIYAASAGKLFRIADEDGDNEWKIGSIKVSSTEAGSEGITARISVDPNSIKVVYGNRSTVLEANKLEIAYPGGNSNLTVKIGNGGNGNLPDENVDKSKLKELLEKAEAYEEDQYTPGSFETLKNAMKSVELLLEDPNAPQAEVNAAAKALKDAIEGLTRVTASSAEADKQQLETFLLQWETEYKDKGDDYDAAAYAALETAINEGREVLEDPSSTPDQIAAAVKKIGEAMMKLKGDVPVDYREELQKLVDESESIKASDYTAESYKAYREAVKKAEEVLENVTSSPHELEEALISLQNAKGALVPAGQGGGQAVTGSGSGQSSSGSGSGSGGNGSGGNTSGSRAASTGDVNSPILWALMAAMALVAAGGVLHLRGKKHS